MQFQDNHLGEWWGSPVLSRLVDGRRRRILDILLHRSESVDERDLATHIAASEHDKPLIEVTREEIEPVRVELRHSHLPVLEDADLIVWCPGESSITTTDHPALHDPRLRYLVERRGEAWDEVMSHLVVERRRITLSVLKVHDGPMSRAALAREVAIRETCADPSGNEVDETRISLHHAHLPKLEASGLIEYDTRDETVAYSGHPELEDAWFDLRPPDSPSTVCSR